MAAFLVAKDRQQWTARLQLAVCRDSIGRPFFHLTLSALQGLESTVPGHAPGDGSGPRRSLLRDGFGARFTVGLEEPVLMRHLVALGIQGFE